FQFLLDTTTSTYVENGAIVVAYSPDSTTPETYLDQKEKLIKYSDFLNKELILFSMENSQRSILSMVDGLKPGQRKIIFCSFKHNFTHEAKVAQFFGYVLGNSTYHHGEQNLVGTIIGKAQDFAGNNDINLLQPNGYAFSRVADEEEAEAISVIRGMRAAHSVGLEKVFLLTDYRRLVSAFELGSDDLSWRALTMAPDLLVSGVRVEADGSYHKYKDSEHVLLYANKVGPFHNPSETYRYYDLPFCVPENVKEKREDLGEVLNGDRLVDVPYELNFRIDKIT
ncbi:hypothetical protein GIB67_020883, partial [Kingdonia uniflora]